MTDQTKLEGLIKQLRHPDRNLASPEYESLGGLCRQAADAISSLLVELARLEAAVKPFAEAADGGDYTFSEADFQRARAALNHRDANDG